MSDTPAVREYTLFNYSNEHTHPHTLLPSLLLVPAVPRACSDIVHSSIAASPGSEAMVFSPHTPPVSLCLSLPLSSLTPAPSLSLSATRCLSLLSFFFFCVPGLKQERELALRRRV